MKNEKVTNLIVFCVALNLCFKDEHEQHQHLAGTGGRPASQDKTEGGL